MTIKEYMAKTGVTKKKYVYDWIEKGLIPGVKQDDNTGEFIFPQSACRPYRPRLRANAKANIIYTSIVNACLKHQYISADIYGMSSGEFQSFINELIAAELIKERLEDNVIYYDATIKSSKYLNEPFCDIGKFIMASLGVIAKNAAYGAVKALCEESKVA